MLAKKYHYDYFSIEALSNYNKITYQGIIIPELIKSTTYPLCNGKEVMDFLVDMGANILTTLKSQGVDIQNQNSPAVAEIIKKCMTHTLTNLKLQVILEDGYKCWFIQHAQGPISFDLRQIGRLDPYQNKIVPIKPYILGGRDLSVVHPDVWVANWVPVIAG